MSKIFETVKSALVGALTTLDRPYAAELYTRLYKDNFGEVYTRLSDDCQAADNMVVCIMGYELLEAVYGNTEYFGNKWGEQLSDDDLQAMLALAETWFNDNPEGMDKIWENLEI